MSISTISLFSPCSEKMAISCPLSTGWVFWFKETNRYLAWCLRFLNYVIQYISECHSITVYYTENAIKRHSVVPYHDINSLCSDVSNSETGTGYTWSKVETVDSPGKILCHSCNWEKRHLNKHSSACRWLGIHMSLWSNFIHAAVSVAHLDCHVVSICFQDVLTWLCLCGAHMTFMLFACIYAASI